MKRVGLFFGGMGNEAEVSVISARNVAANIDRSAYELVLIYWYSDGCFYQVNDFDNLTAPNIKIEETSFKSLFEVALPMTHGRFGEDGILQGIFERYNIPYGGCRVLSSALCMDKAVCKTFLSGQHIPQVRYVVIDMNVLSVGEIEFEKTRVKNEFVFPLFVKPANSGSSVGVSKVEAEEKLDEAIAEAAKHDRKIVIEEGLVGLREVEVGILGNSSLTTSRPGELILAKEFYDYDEKYKNNQTEVKIPADLTPEQEEEIVILAEKIYKLCDCRGFSRLDFFISGKTIYFNEINTLPGFTQFSMYPMLMMNKGMTYAELLNRIIELAY